MKKYKFYIRTTYVNSKIEEIIEVDDDDVSEDELKEMFTNWLGETCDYGYYEIVEQ